MSKKYSNTIDWVLNQMTKSRPYPERYKRDKEFVDEKKLYFCTKCNKAWEKIVKPQKIAYYEDFPSIGLTKQGCAKCQKNK